MRNAPIIQSCVQKKRRLQTAGRAASRRIWGFTFGDLGWGRSSVAECLLGIYKVLGSDWGQGGGRTAICRISRRESGFRMGDPSVKGKEWVLQSRGRSFPQDQQCILRKFFLNPSEAVPNLSSATTHFLLLAPLGRRKPLAHCFCLLHPRPRGPGLSPLLRFASFLLLPFSRYLGSCLS